jgi:hypothetical protein
MNIQSILETVATCFGNVVVEDSNDTHASVKDVETGRNGSIGVVNGKLMTAQYHTHGVWYVVEFNNIEAAIDFLTMPENERYNFRPYIVAEKYTAVFPF